MTCNALPWIGTIVLAVGAGVLLGYSVAKLDRCEGCDWAQRSRDKGAV